MKSPGTDTVTFRELLTHRAGFRYDSGAVFTDEHAAQKQVRVGIQPEDKSVAEYNNIDFSIFRDVLPVFDKRAASVAPHGRRHLRHVLGKLGINTRFALTKHFLADEAA